MKKALWTVAAAALAASTAWASGPSPEALKGSAGVRFGESMGRGQASEQAGAVYGGADAVERPALTIEEPGSGKGLRTQAVPAPQAPPRDGKADPSVGRWLVRTFGGIAGAVAGMLFAISAPLIAAAAVAGGAIAGGALAERRPGRALDDLLVGVAKGVWAVAALPVKAGLFIGDKIGGFIEEVFRVP